LQAQNTVEGVLDTVCERLARALNAREVRWAEDPAGAVATTDLPRYSVRIGDLTAGRRLLSDDLALIDSVVTLAARRIDQIRLTHERYEVQLREEEMLKLTAEAELKALRAQVNPHFLFNALTTIGYLIETAPPRALNTLMQLTALLRGVLKSEGEFTTLGRELELVEHYLKIEHERFEERLRVRIDVPHALRAHRLPTLVLQPLVENAIKHGVAPSRTGGDVEVQARLDGDRLRLTVQNSGAPLRTASERRPGEHVGVDNVRRRLAGHYGPDARLTLTTDHDGRTVAELFVPIVAAAAAEDPGHAEAAAGRPR
jgi:LytS/YehU family sensor histidine kinase